jgi:diguanylate cyclase (GGDEF)-like protein
MDMAVSFARLRLSRRSGDGRWQDGLRRVIVWTGAQWEPVGGGRLLLLVTGVVVTLTAPLVDHGFRNWQLLAEVAVAMSCLLIASYTVPWLQLPRRATLMFPFSVAVALAALGLLGHGLGANFAGLLTLCFAYVGLTQTTATCVLSLPVATAGYVASYDGWSNPVLARLPIALAVWTLLAVLLAELIERQNTMTGQLHTIANTDALTGIGNRRDLEHRLSATRVGDALVMCDLDHFKKVNDSLGHTVGDAILADFGSVMRTCLREGDYAGRYGGEEFVLVLTGTSPAEAAATLRRLRQHFATLQPDITFSAGIATCSGRSPAETLRAADRALYRAKDLGRNRDCVEMSAS